MRKQHRRIGLIGSASVLALAVGFLQPALADTSVTVGSIVPAAVDPADILSALATAGGVAGTTNILSDQNLGGLNLGTATTTGSTAAPVVAVGDNAVANNNNNNLFALTRANNVASTIGNNSSADGSVILNAQQLVPGVAAGAVTTLTASTTGSIDSSLLIGNGANVTGNLNNNSVRARTSFNTAFGAIETTVPNTLLGGAAGGYVAAFTGAAPSVDPSSLAQVATYNIASVQANSGFANGAGAGLATSHVDDTLISLTRVYTSLAPATISGTFRVNNNLVDAATVGNAADNGILLETGVAGTFDGTAFSSSTQLSRDTTVPAVGSLPGISASNTDTVITANLFNFLPGLVFLSSGDGLTVRVNGNQISSSATINEASNLVGFDSGLNLAGGDSPSANALSYGAANVNNVLVVFSDFATVNQQNAFAGLGPTQSAFAETDDATVLFFIEGVSDDTTITLNDNVLSASAEGNISTNLVINHALGIPNDPGASLGTGDSATIVGSFASANRQLIYRPDIEAIMTDSEIQALIGTTNLGFTPFGGFAGSTLRLNDNSFSAVATGNGATALIDLQGASIDSDTAGASLVADRENPAQIFSIGGASGISIANLQFNAQVPGTPGSLVSTVRGNTIEAIVADDLGTVEDWIVSDATLTLNGNSFQASSTVNGYAGLVNLTAGTTIAGDASVGSSQTTGGFGAIDIGATLSGNQANAILGIGTLAESLTVSLRDNGMLALATGNDALQALNVNAGTSITGDTTTTLSGDNAHVVPSGVATQETLNTEIQAAGAFVVVNDQAINFSDFLATATGNSLTVDLNPTTDGIVSGLASSALRVSGNQIASQVLGNNADNSLGITASNGLGVTGTGAIGGIANSQTGAVVVAGDITLSAVTTGNTIAVSVLDGDNVQGITDLVVDVGEHIDDEGVVHRNAIGSTAFASIATNSVEATAGTIDATATGVSLSVVNGAIDQTLSIDDTALYVLNRQRNEALDPTDLVTPARGAAVSATTSGNGVDVFVNGGVDGVDSSRLNATGNILDATAAANVATNSIASTAGTTASLASGILSRQGNSGNVTGTNSLSIVSLEVTADDDAVHTDLRASADRNAIGASAIGNSVTNTLNASAGTTLNGTNGAGASGAFIGTAVPAGPFYASVDSDSGTLDSNADATLLGNAGILSTQRNYGLAGDRSLITSSLTDASVSLGITNGDVSTTQGVLSVSLNQAVSQAAANAATNNLTTTSGTSSAGAATVLNSQGASETTVSASATDTSFGSTVDGPISSATLQVSNNLILASADLNSASNTITGTAGVGGLPSATILNHQEASNSSVSSSVTGSSITQLGLGGVTNSTVSVSGNQIGTSSTINNSVNKIAAPGQSFTRTSSF